MSDISRATPEFTVYHLDDAYSCSGTASCRRDGTDYAIYHRAIQPQDRRPANMTLYLTRRGSPRCTAAWMSGSQHSGSGVLNTNAGPRIPGQDHHGDRCMTFEKPDGTIHTVVYVNDPYPISNPDKSNMPPDHTKAFEVPLMVIAQNLNIKPSWLTPSVSASSQTCTGGPTEGDEASKRGVTSTSGIDGPGVSLAEISSDTQATGN